MAIRLSKNTKSNEQPKGFDISFSPGEDYNLDEIISNKNRKFSDKKLLLEVKNEKQLSSNVLNILLKDIQLNIDSELGKIDITERINNIIEAAYRAYPNVSNTDLTNKNILNFINLHINKILNEKFDVYRLKYVIELKNASNAVITYDMESEQLNELFIQYYEKYANHLEKDLTNVQEGGLAISDSKNIKINPLYSDYKKYLIDNTAKKEVIGTSNYKTVINWEDYTDDHREQEDILEAPIEILETYFNKVVEHIQGVEIGTLNPELDTLHELGEKIEKLSDDMFGREPIYIDNDYIFDEPLLPPLENYSFIGRNEFEQTINDVKESQTPTLDDGILKWGDTDV